MSSPFDDDPFGPEEPTIVSSTHPTPVHNFSIEAFGEKRFQDGVTLMAIGLRYGLIRCGVDPKEVSRIVTNVREWGEAILTAAASRARKPPTPSPRGAGRPP